MIERKLLLGDEAIALGAVHAGISGVYAYPGTPSTEITEYIQGHAPEVRSRWCTNEKTAMEAALGMSYAGKRALVCMKHVGMNVAADAFVNSAITGVNRVGTDPTCEYCGGSVIIDPYGKTIAACAMGEECEATAEVDMESLEAFRKKFPVLNDADI